MIIKINFKLVTSDHHTHLFTIPSFIAVFVLGKIQKKPRKMYCNPLRASGPNDGTIWVEKITAKNASVSCSHEMWALRAFSKGFLDRGRKLVRDLYRHG